MKAVGRRFTVLALLVKLLTLCVPASSDAPRRLGRLTALSRVPIKVRAGDEAGSRSVGLKQAVLSRLKKQLPRDATPVIRPYSYRPYRFSSAARSAAAAGKRVTGGGGRRESELGTGSSGPPRPATRKPAAVRSPALQSAPTAVRRRIAPATSQLSSANRTRPEYGDPQAGKLQMEPDGMMAAVLPQAGRLHRASALHVIPGSVDGPGWELLCAWVTRVEGTAGAAIALSRLTSLADEQWQRPSFVVRTLWRSIENPVWAMQGAGQLQLMYANQDKNAKNSTVMQRLRSTDAGWHWSSPETVAYLTNGAVSSAVVRGWDGDCFLLLCSPSQGVTLLRTTHNGEAQWEAVATVPSPAVLLHQPTLLLVKDQWVALFLETCCTPGAVWTGGVHRSVSGKAAQDWTPPVTITTLPLRCRELQAITLRSGVVAAIIGHHRTEQDVRTYLSIALSSDAGRNWEHIRDLRRSYIAGARPSIAQLPDGSIHVTYTYAEAGDDEAGYHSIRHLRVTEEWVREGLGEAGWQA